MEVQKICRDIVSMAVTCRHTLKKAATKIKYVPVLSKSSAELSTVCILTHIGTHKEKKRYRVKCLRVHTKIMKCALMKASRPLTNRSNAKPSGHVK